MYTDVQVQLNVALDTKANSLEKDFLTLFQNKSVPEFYSVCFRTTMAKNVSICLLQPETPD